MNKEDFLNFLAEEEINLPSKFFTEEKYFKDALDKTGNFVDLKKFRTHLYFFVLSNVNT